MSNVEEHNVEAAPVDVDDQMSVVADEQEAGKKKERLKAVVTRIGPEPLLKIEGMDEFRFAYRNVKKKHGDARPFIQVGDRVECRLTKSVPPKAVSVRLAKKQPTDATVGAKNTEENSVDTESTEPATPAVAENEDKPAEKKETKQHVLCDEVNADDIDDAIDTCLNDEYLNNNQMYTADDSCGVSCGGPRTTALWSDDYYDEMIMLTAYDYGY